MMGGSVLGSGPTPGPYGSETAPPQVFHPQAARLAAEMSDFVVADIQSFNSG